MIAIDHDIGDGVFTGVLCCSARPASEMCQAAVGGPIATLRLPAVDMREALAEN